MLNIKHEPMVDIKELAAELNLAPDNFSFFNEPTDVYLLDTTQAAITSLEREIKIIEEVDDPDVACGYYYNPMWIPLFEADIAAIKLLREKYGFNDHVLVRKH